MYFLTMTMMTVFFQGHDLHLLPRGRQPGPHPRRGRQRLAAVDALHAEPLRPGGGLCHLGGGRKFAQTACGARLAVGHLGLLVIFGADFFLEKPLIGMIFSDF